MDCLCGARERRNWDEHRVTGVTISERKSDFVFQHNMRMTIDQ